MLSELELIIVDDEPAILNGIYRVLQDYTFYIDEIDQYVVLKVSTYDRGKTVLEGIDKKKVDIIFLDYMISDIEGDIFIEQLKSRAFDGAVIVLINFASLDIAVKAAKKGAYDFLAKPFTPEELRSSARRCAKNLIMLRHAKKLEEEKKKVRFQFLSVLSHELKAPLNAIEGYLKILDSRVAGDNIESYGQLIKRSISRIEWMKKLIFDLLDLTRIESGEKKREVKIVDMVEALKHSVETNLPRAHEMDVAIVLKFPDKVEMLGEISELEIIFNNLISNGIKYNIKGGKLEVEIASNSQYVDIKVKDTGIGMKPEEVSRLFNEFVRFKNEKTKGIEGTGLGLSILKKIVMLYLGKIDVKSQYGKGTTFHIKLNRYQDNSKNKSG